MILFKWYYKGFPIIQVLYFIVFHIWLCILKKYENLIVANTTKVAVLILFLKVHNNSGFTIYFNNDQISPREKILHGQLYNPGCVRL